MGGSGGVAEVFNTVDDINPADLKDPKLWELW